MIIENGEKKEKNGIHNPGYETPIQTQKCSDNKTVQIINEKDKLAADDNVNKVKTIFITDKISDHHVSANSHGFNLFIPGNLTLLRKYPHKISFQTKIFIISQKSSETFNSL